MDAMENLIGQLLENRYQVETFLGRGGMADVYKVWDQQRAVHLAMKVLHADLAEDVVFLSRFEHEAQTLDRLQHPNIVRFYGLSTSGSMAFILMDFIDGLTLRKEILLKRTKVSPQRVLEIMQPVCAALHYAHQMGMIHSDIKPANIMIHSNGMVYLTDFGIARVSETGTSAVGYPGTPAYMAPEQFSGAPPSPAIDIYALGVVMFEMLTGGWRPFTGERAQIPGSITQKIVWEKLNLPPTSPLQFQPQIDPALEEVIFRCLHRDPAARYASALELSKALLRAVTGESEEGESPTLMEVLSESYASEKPDPALPTFKPPAGHPKPYPPLATPAPRVVPIFWMLVSVLVGVGILVAGFLFFRPSRWALSSAALTETAYQNALPKEVVLGQVAKPALTTLLAPTATATPSPLPSPTAEPTPQPTVLGGGSLIAFASNRSGTVQVWTMDWQGENRRQITDMPKGACDPAWSPDGQKLAFISPCQGSRPAYPGSKIYIVGMDGSEPEVLPLPLGGYDPAWSPDGRQITFTYMYAENTAISRYDLETQTVSPLVGRGNHSTQSAWGSVDNRLAFITDDRQPGEIWLVDQEGKSQEQFYQGNLLEAFSYPDWAPGGNWMIATLKRTDLIEPSLVRLEKQEGGKVVTSPFLVDSFPATHASFSPDGQWVVFEGWLETVNHEIFIASADGKIVNRLTNQKSLDFQPTWQPY